MIRISFHTLIALTILLGTTTVLRADPLDDTILDLMAKRKIPGLSLAVIKDGVIVKAKGYGVTSLAGGSPVTPDTLFQAGSDSKAVAAIGALYLVDQKKLTLDRNVNELLHSWHVPENAFTTGHPVTLRELLSHTAGMTVHGFRGYATTGPVPTLEQVLDGEPPANSPAIRVEATPGSKWNYSGGGYVVAQQLMNDVSGKPFPEFMQEHVLRPLGMNASTFAQPLPPARAALAATAYPQVGRPVPGGSNVYPEMAPAGLWTTASDLARFAISLQQSFAGQPHPVLTAASARLMITPVMNHYALGLAVKGEGQSAMFSHGGRNEGFDTLLNAYTNVGLGVVIMINANDNSRFMIRVQDAVALAYGWPDYHPYVSPSPIPDLEPAVTEQLRQVYLAALEGKLDQALFTPALGKSLAAVIPGQVTNELKASGPLKSFSLVEHKEYPGGHRVYQYLIITGETVLLRCSYNASGKIERLILIPE
jgi:CubicO group peptidase (beta-lactamase class C family)